MEAYADMGRTPQNPHGGFPLQGLQFGPVQPYGLIGALAKPLPLGFKEGPSQVLFLGLGEVLQLELEDGGL